MSKTPAELMHDASFRRLVVYASVTAFSVLILSLTTCTIHMNTYNADEAKANIANTEAQAKIELEENQQKHAAEMERLNAIQKMIEDEGVNPIAARCAVVGWDNFTAAEQSICKAAATTTPIIIKTTGEINEQ